MASPMPMAPMGSWPGNQAVPVAQTDSADAGLQVKTMGLKVHYTFDKDAKVNCLARFPQSIQVQTVPIDDTNTIGVIDLRVCMQAVTECSPELAGQDCDYTIYALDYSEPDTPLVGQGMLSWAIDSMRGTGPPQQPKLVTGRVTKNLLGVFGGGNRETLEVKLKLAETAKVLRIEAQQNLVEAPPQQQQSRPVETVMTPTGTSEWNSFIQSNPQLGQPAQISRVASPALSQGIPAALSRRESFGPHMQPILPAGEIPQRIAPVAIEPKSKPAASSRPSSRTSNRPPRRKAPTGRPRGRPRKKPVEGNTSGYEDGTEGEEGPAKKRAKTTQVDKTTSNIFGSGPESLRVAASTSGSIRTFRPIGISGDPNAPQHLQEIPRAPTPVPDSSMKVPRQGSSLGKLRRESTTMSMDSIPNESTQPSDARPAFSPGQEDARSPDSMAPTPVYSEDSPGDIGSSPPVPRTTPFSASFMRSSPPPSSPILPPMPMPPSQLPEEASFVTNDLEDLFGDMQQDVNEEIPPTQVHIQRAIETTDATGVPFQVFELKGGPDGQDLVNIRNHNTHRMHYGPAAPVAPNDTPPLPPLRHESWPSENGAALNEIKGTALPPPPQVPTPPPTTDAAEKPASPLTLTDSMDKACDKETAPAQKASDHPPSTREQPSQDPSATQNTLPDATKPKPPRQLSRSQSAGPLALPVPASEPAGPSSLSQCTAAEPEPAGSAIALPVPIRRSASTGPLCLPVPASDPIAPSRTPLPELRLPEQACSTTEVPPSSPPNGKSNKNFVKKFAIKQRLEEAIMNGEMPPYCSNCGAIETPTWRKIWIQEKEGVPEYVEYSEKPGRITAIEILKRDKEDKPCLYRLVKKALAPLDDRSLWQEKLLCNPCGIWLSKFKLHRPPDRWDKDAGRLGQERRKRGPGAGGSRSKKARTKSDAQSNLTSEAYLPTDALGPVEESSPKFLEPAPVLGGAFEPSNGAGPAADRSTSLMEAPSEGGAPRSNPGSTHSRGSGTAKSPIDVELDEAMGTTKRVLFPSPKKDEMPKVLGEVHINIVHTECRQQKDLTADKENVVIVDEDATLQVDDDLEALFRSPGIARPSTPPPNAKSCATAGPFKTPTRPTPSHRPITRSVSRSIRTVRSLGAASPGQLDFLNRTPIRTPSSKRRSPRNHEGSFGDIPDTPISRTIHQMLTDAAEFGISDKDLEFGQLPNLNGPGDEFLDLGSLLSTDAIMPSSPKSGAAMGFDYEGSSSMWAQWAADNATSVKKEEIDG